MRDQNARKRARQNLNDQRGEEFFDVEGTQSDQFRPHDRSFGDATDLRRAWNSFVAGFCRTFGLTTPTCCDADPSLCDAPSSAQANQRHRQGHRPGGFVARRIRSVDNQSELNAAIEWANVSNATALAISNSSATGVPYGILANSSVAAIAGPGVNNDTKLTSNSSTAVGDRQYANSVDSALLTFATLAARADGANNPEIQNTLTSINDGWAQNERIGRNLEILELLRRAPQENRTLTTADVPSKLKLEENPISVSMNNATIAVA